VERPAHRLRLATEQDRPALEDLISRSVRGLMGEDYSALQLESALRHVFGVDAELLQDGTYFLIEAEGVLLAAGGWSRRRTLYGGDHSVSGRVDGPLLDPTRDPARIRAFFVDPAHARRGLGHALFVACHDAARACGFTRLELAATLTGVRLYAREGFQPLERIEIAFPDGLKFPVIRMVRPIEPKRDV
jgi:GNAT superfamily N-acetyltransferase